MNTVADRKTGRATCARRLAPARVMVKALGFSYSVPVAVFKEQASPRVRADGAVVPYAVFEVTPGSGRHLSSVRWMKTDSLVQSHLEPGKGGPARTVYSLSEEGEAYLLACTASLEGIRAMIEGFLAFIPASLDQEDAR